MSTNAEKRNDAVKRIYCKEKGLQWEVPFCFIQAADTQLGMIESNIKKQENGGWSQELELIRATLVAANKMTPRPKFYVVCGDLVNAFPGQNQREEQVRDFKQVYEGLDNQIPLVCVCGNHDVGDKPTPETITGYRNDYGDDYFAFWVSGVLFIALNSQYYENRTEVQALAEEQDAWLDALLIEAQSSGVKHIIVLQHIPWFLETPDEEKQYFNIEMPLRQQMLDKFYDAGVRAIFCGHYHRNAGGAYKDLQLVVTSAVGAQLGNDKNGLRVVKVLEDRIAHKYFAVDEIPESITF